MNLLRLLLLGSDYIDPNVTFIFVRNQSITTGSSLIICAPRPPAPA
jgi:hypothetical protein